MIIDTATNKEIKFGEYIKIHKEIVIRSNPSITASQDQYILLNEASCEYLKKEGYIKEVNEVSTSSTQELYNIRKQSVLAEENLKRAMASLQQSCADFELVVRDLAQINKELNNLKLSGK